MGCSQAKPTSLLLVVAFVVVAAAVVADRPDAITSTAGRTLSAIARPSGFDCQPFPTLSGEGESICHCRMHLHAPCTFWSSSGASRPKGHQSCDQPFEASTSHVTSCHALMYSYCRRHMIVPCWWQQLRLQYSNLNQAGVDAAAESLNWQRLQRLDHACFPACRQPGLALGVLQWRYLSRWER
jgi:hypothetical protein